MVKLFVILPDRWLQRVLRFCPVLGLCPPASSTCLVCLRLNKTFEQVPDGMENVVAETEEVHFEIWKASRAINLIGPECIDTDKSYLQ